MRFDLGAFQSIVTMIQKMLDPTGKFFFTQAIALQRFALGQQALDNGSHDDQFPRRSPA